MAACAPRRIQSRQGGDEGVLTGLGGDLAAANDIAAAFDALTGRGREIGFQALLCRQDEAAAGPPRDFHTFAEPVARLFADAEFRRSWPIERATLGAALPLLWTTTNWPGDRGAAARVAMSRLAAVGVEAGVSLALRGPLGLTLVLTGTGSAARLQAVTGDELDRWAAAAARFLARVVDLSTEPPLPQLSRREAEILNLSAEGRTAAMAARMLGVTEATIKFHLAGARKKLGVRNTAEAVAKLHILKARWRP